MTKIFEKFVLKMKFFKYPENSYLHFIDSGEIVWIFKEINPKIISTSWNKQNNVFRSFSKSAQKPINKLVGMNRKLTKNSQKILDDTFRRTIWKIYRINGWGPRFSKNSVREWNFLNMYPQNSYLHFIHSGKIVGILEEMNPKATFYKSI